MYRMPRYFLITFGAAHAAEHPVEGGVYPHEKGFVSSSGIVAGDVMLLYCAGSFNGHNNEFPGLGVVTSTEIGSEKESIYYQYFPLCHPISVDWDTMKVTIPELAPPGNRIWRYRGNWLRQIASSSFRAAIAGRQVDWP